MKLSVFTTHTNPIQRGDLIVEAIDCYAGFADEVIQIDGTDPETLWPYDFNWPLIGQQFQRGYEKATGDWVIHADLDFIFHEDNYGDIFKACQDNNNAPALTFWKYQFILPDRYNLKSRLVLAVNKAKYGDRIRFDSGGDLCQPSLDGEYLTPDKVPEARIPFFNYEKILKTKEQLAQDCGRMERAWKAHFGHYQMGSDGTNESALKVYMNLVKHRFNKPQERVSLEFHPQIMHNTIKSLTLDQFGYSGHGELEINDYAKGLA